MSKIKMMGLALSAIAAGAVLTACSNSTHAAMPGMSGSATAPAPAPAAQTSHNQADVTFAQQMIPHHQQAVQMANLVPSHTSNQQVVALAAQIQKEQDPEIQQMTGWLQQWGVSGTMPGMGMPGMSSTMPMPGLMSSAEMAQLGNVKDAAFDRTWLQMMVQHHQGAIDMAKTELQQGGNAQAKQLAQTIIDGQQAEITTMNGLLSQM
jgi:uncharacterized protein (DUF305 family)